MKILELLEDIETARSTVNLNRNLGTKQASYKGTTGAGYFSVVRPDRDPHMIKKYAKRNVGKDDMGDPFHKYIDYIIDHNLSSNIYFPRVYNIKDIVDPEGRRNRKYTIEKLISWHDVTPEDIEAICDRIFTDPDTFAHIINVHPNTGFPIEYNEINPLGTVQKLQDNLCTALNQRIRADSIKNIKDKQLADAIKIIHNINADVNSTVDLHSDNLMYRRTSYGVQPVFNDPIA